jgi:phosphonate transport system substrate-binding protein
MKKTMTIYHGLITLGLVMGFSCPPSQADQPTVLRVGFAPFENQADVLQKAKPIIKALSHDLNMTVKPFVAADYPGVIEAMKGKRLDVAFYSPAALVLAEKKANAKVILKSIYKKRAFYYSAIITRKDSNIKSLNDLKGKTFAFVDPTSTTGGVYPKLMLLKAGLKPERDFKRVIYTGGHDAAILAVAHHKVDACATFANDTRGIDVPWRKMFKANPVTSQLIALSYSPPIPNGAVAVRGDLSPVLVQKIRQTFLNLGRSPEGRAELSKMYLIEEFAVAQSKDYDPVREASRLIGLKL